MKLFGITFGRRKALAPPSGNGGWRSIIREPLVGAWQRNQEVAAEDMLAFHAVFACITLIASDTAKLGLKLHRKDSNGVWEPVEGGLSDLLRRPNAYQTRSQFLAGWSISKSARGNTYVLKERDAAGAVARLHVLHPDRVKPLISDSGEVYYQLNTDKLAGLEESDGQIVVPASEIIHDRYNCLYHPLVGLPPLYAASAAVIQGRNIQSNSSSFFGNNSNPGGILTAPGAISDETAARMKRDWETNYSGPQNAGKVAVLGDGLKYEPMAVTATDAQLIEQLRWTAEVVCSVYHVPPYKIGVGQMPSYNNIQALNQEYYSQCLQTLLMDIQGLLNDGLEVGKDEGFRFDLESLLMMDSQTQMNVLKEGVGSGVFEPNHARRKFNLPPVEGGDTPYLQQQNYSLAALAKRDSTQEAYAQPSSDQTPTDAASESGNIQQEALNGAQVTALQGIIFAVASGDLPPETAAALIRVAFPLVTEEQIDDMLAGAVSDAPPADDEGQSDPEEAAKWLAILVEKELSSVEYA